MNRAETPLAERMRPRSLEEYVGHASLMGPGAAFRSLLSSGQVPSCVIFGPPGVGKTALVRLMASVTQRELLEINAVTAKVSELRELVQHGANLRRLTGRSPVAFVDELYHFSSSQQNALLPSVERGDVILVGTTTENPTYSINKTLLSRLVVLTLEPLKDSEIRCLLERALQDTERGLGDLSVTCDGEVLHRLAQSSAGDGRQALTRLEYVVTSMVACGRRHLTVDQLETLLPRAMARYDRQGDDHYAVISAFIKSIRGSDPDAAVYWLGRMIDAGEAPEFIARRLIISAAEDVGLADPNGLVVAVSAAEALERIGMPEGRIPLAEATVYLAAAPKSNRAYQAINHVLEHLSQHSPSPVPRHLVNGNGGYLYPHEYAGSFVPQAYVSEYRCFYDPSDQGIEHRIAERLKALWPHRYK